MPGMNLTRAEALGRSTIVDVDSYEISLDLTTGDAHFQSTTVIHFRAVPGSSTFIDLVDATSLDVTLNDEPLAHDAYQDSRIQVEDLNEVNTLRVSASLPYSRTGEGLHRFVDPADGRVYLYSQFEVPDARRVYACFEQPDLKATYTFSVTAAEHWQVVSNSPTPAPISQGDGTATWNFAPTEKMSTYITGSSVSRVR